MKVNNFIVGNNKSGNVSLYYILMEKDYKGRKEDIGDIMTAFNNILVEKTGLSLGIYTGSTSDEIKLFSATQGIEVLNEDVLWVNMTDEEKAEKFSEYLLHINSKDGDLLIIDLYIFSPKAQDVAYISLLSKILLKSASKTITVITDKSKCNQDTYCKIQDKINVKVNIVYNTKWHDRFWIVNYQKGFVTGTSLN